MSESVPGMTPEVFAPVKAPVSPPQASEEVEVVQLLTPEGERVEHPDYSFDLDDEAIKGFYRDMTLVRRIDAEATALQRQGELDRPEVRPEVAAVHRDRVDEDLADLAGERGELGFVEPAQGLGAVDRFEQESANSVRRQSAGRSPIW